MTIWGKLPPWEATKNLHYNNAGNGWQECRRAWVKDGGVWKQVHGALMDWPGTIGDTNRSLLLHLDETAVPFVDSGDLSLNVDSPWPYESMGYIQAFPDTSVYKFGSASARFEPTYSTMWFFSNIVVGPNKPAFNFGQKDFTIDFQVMFRDPVLVGGSWAYHWFFFRDAQLDFFWQYDPTLGPGDPGYNGSKTLTNQLIGRVNRIGSWIAPTQWNPYINTWYHVAVVRYNGTIHTCIDGVEIDSYYYPYDINCTSEAAGYADASYFWVGHIPNASCLNGWMQEFRVLNGTASWTSFPFSPPVAPYT